MHKLKLPQETGEFVSYHKQQTATVTWVRQTEIKVPHLDNIITVCHTRKQESLDHLLQWIYSKTASKKNWITKYT